MTYDYDCTMVLSRGVKPLSPAPTNTWPISWEVLGKKGLSRYEQSAVQSRVALIEEPRENNL